MLEASNQYLDVILLGLLLDATSAGIYFAAARIANAFSKVTTGVADYASSRISLLYFSNQRTELIAMVKTNLDEDASPYSAFSMIVVPTKTPGVNILRDVPTMGEPDHKTGEPGGHAEIKYEEVRVPFENVVGGEAGIG